MYHFFDSKISLTQLTLFLKHYFRNANFTDTPRSVSKSKTQDTFDARSSKSQNSSHFSTPLKKSQTVLSSEIVRVRTMLNNDPKLKEQIIQKLREMSVKKVFEYYRSVIPVSELKEMRCRDLTTIRIKLYFLYVRKILKRFQNDRMEDYEKIKKFNKKSPYPQDLKDLALELLKKNSTNP